MEDDDESKVITKLNTLKLFGKTVDAAHDSPYKFVIKNVIEYELSVAHTFFRLTFRQTVRVSDQHNTICKNPLLAGINDYNVGQFVRVKVGINLHVMASIFARKRVWALFIA